MSTHDVSKASNVADVSSEKSRARQFSELLKQQQSIMGKYGNISSWFPDDMQRVAEQCWAQIYPHIGPAVQESNASVLLEFKVYEHLNRLEKLKADHHNDQPSWRPSGIPAADYNTAAVAEGRKLVPDFEKQYNEAQELTREFQDVILEKQEELKELEVQINAALCDLDGQLANILQPSSDSK